jgi:hypothetical protein
MASVTSYVRAHEALLDAGREMRKHLKIVHGFHKTFNMAPGGTIHTIVGNKHYTVGVQEYDRNVINPKAFLAAVDKNMDILFDVVDVIKERAKYYLDEGALDEITDSVTKSKFDIKEMK